MSFSDIRAIEFHTDNDTCESGGKHVFKITTGKTASLESIIPDEWEIWLVNDIESTAVLTIDAGAVNINGEAGNLELTAGQFIYLVFDGTEWRWFAGTFTVAGG